MVRALRQEDIEPLLALFERVAAERLWIGTEPDFDRERYRAAWRKQIAGAWGAGFVAFVDNDLAGYAGSHPHDEYEYVLAMLVDERYRGRGLGTTLLQAAIDWARASGLSQINLLVFPHNVAALALYRKAGFEEREYYERDCVRQTGDVFDTMRMTKRLR